VSWHQENPSRSLELIERTGVGVDAPIVDVGGGSSRLVDGLVDQGYTNLSVLDLSSAALAYAQERLRNRAGMVDWIQADVTEYPFDGSFDVWHDRAVFHFLVDPADRGHYVERLEAAVRPGGHAILATFSLDGPEQCSGLPVQRYSAESMSLALGLGFEAVSFEEEAHLTPSGVTQHFLYGHFRRHGVNTSG
jgi:2-polyprenyl-3-methyl-5-hydroxy-6-metoxy-1,4-benzoquinol methylase